MFNGGDQTAWSHESFLVLPTSATQHKLSNKLSEAQVIHFTHLGSRRDAIRLNSCSGIGASSFFFYFLNYSWLFFLDLMTPLQWVCGARLDPQEHQLLKYKIRNEWDQRHSAVLQCVTAIFKSTTNEVPLPKIAPPAPGHPIPTGRMDLEVTNLQRLLYHLSWCYFYSSIPRF